MQLTRTVRKNSRSVSKSTVYPFPGLRPLKKADSWRSQSFSEVRSWPKNFEGSLAESMFFYLPKTPLWRPMGNMSPYAICSPSAASAWSTSPFPVPRFSSDPFAPFVVPAAPADPHSCANAQKPEPPQLLACHPSLTTLFTSPWFAALLSTPGRSGLSHLPAPLHAGGPHHLSGTVQTRNFHHWQGRCISIVRSLPRIQCDSPGPRRPCQAPQDEKDQQGGTSDIPATTSSWRRG